MIVQEVGMDKQYVMLTDVKTRWNSTYLAWKRLNTLRHAVQSLAGSLQFASDRDT